MGGDNDLTFGQKAALQWAGFKKFVWNKEEQTFMSRGGKSWAHLLLFYFIFYICLAAFWAAMLAVFLQTIDPNKPTWTSYVSRPGLAFTPNVKYNKITFNPNKENSYKDYVKKLQDIINYYKGEETSGGKQGPDQEGEGFIDCTSKTEPNSMPTEQFCKYPVEKFEPCTGGNFGYDDVDSPSPCIFLNLNKIWGWTPENFGEGEDPVDPPADVDVMNGYITIDCVEAEASDKYIQYIENITVSAMNRIPFGHFPYQMGTDKELQRKYLIPYVAVKVSFTGDFYGKDIKMTCEAYAGNIQPIKGIYESEALPKFDMVFTVEK